MKTITIRKADRYFRFQLTKSKQHLICDDKVVAYRKKDSWSIYSSNTDVIKKALSVFGLINKNQRLETEQLGV
jgi:hypothetical protein